jgi:hypothetical protein
MDKLTQKIIDNLEPLETWNLTLTRVNQVLSFALKEKRRVNNDNTYYAIFIANELNRQITLLASCGLQKDIINRIHGYYLSFNNIWTDTIKPDETRTSFYINNDGKNKIAKQLDAIFSKHRFQYYDISLVKVSQHEYIVFLCAERNDINQKIFSKTEDKDLRLISDKIFLAYLKEYKDKHISDWEKAVHEIASPLDFIFSNGDYLKYYFTRQDISEEQKLLKISDIILIADLLLYRLHQYRYAFAGIPEGVKMSL